MKRRVGILLLISAAGFFCFKLATRPADPIFRERRASAWVAEYLDYRLQNPESYSNVIALGAPAAPHLARCLPIRGADSRWLPRVVVERIPQLDDDADSSRQNNRRSDALRALAELGPASAGALPQLMELLAHGSQEHEANANYVLRRIGAPAAAALRNALRDSSEQLRARAAKCLQDFQASPDNVAALERALRDKSANVRAFAAESLGALREGEIALSKALNDDAASVRAKACEALGKIAARAIVPALRARFEDPDAAVRFHAAKAVWTIEHNPRETLPVFVQLLKSPESWRAAHALGEMRYAAAPAIPALLRAMRREQVPRPFRSPPSAAFALGQIPSAAPALAELLTDPQTSVRVSAALALGFMGHAAEPAASRLLGVLADSNPDVRIASALTLGAIGSHDARTISALEEGLHAEDIFLRSRSADLLRKLAPDREWFAATE